MFAALPPLSSTPEEADGTPSQSLNQSITVSSTWLGPAASIHEPAYTFKADAMKSPTAPGNVWQDGMNAKNLGWSGRLMYGSTSSESRSSTAPKSCAAAGGGSAIRAAISSGDARRRAGIDGSLSRPLSRPTAWYPSARIAWGESESPGAGLVSPPMVTPGRGAVPRRGPARRPAPG